VIRESVVLHKVSRSFTGVTAGIGLYYFSRNVLIFAARHLGPGATVRATWYEVLRPALADLVHGRLSQMTLRLLGFFAAVLGRRGRARWLVSAVARGAAGGARAHRSPA
jgi:hypothetical protein